MRRFIVRLAPALMLSLFFASATVYASEPQTLDVKITTHLGDQQSFVDGDRISFLLSLDSDAYVYLFYRDAASNLLQLLPNERMPDHFFNAGLFMPVPSAQQPFQFTVKPPYGDESIYAIASSNDALVFPGKPLANGLILLDQNPQQIIDVIRKKSKNSFGRGELRLTTLPAQQ
jgi:hypothetical protein